MCQRQKTDGSGSGLEYGPRGSQSRGQGMEETPGEILPRAVAWMEERRAGGKALPAGLQVGSQLPICPILFLPLCRKQAAAFSPRPKKQTSMSKESEGVSGEAKVPGMHLVTHTDGLFLGIWGPLCTASYAIPTLKQSLPVTWSILPHTGPTIRIFYW